MKRSMYYSDESYFYDVSDCPSGKWGPNCANSCNNCTEHGACSPITGECVCQNGWKGERWVPTYLLLECEIT